MAPSSPTTAQAESANLAPAKQLTDVLLSLVTGPVLLGIVSTQAVFSWLQTAGIASEEVFRGDRLPVLHFPDSEPQE